MEYFIFIISSLIAQEGPSSQQICLQETIALEKILQSSQCQWPKNKIKKTEMYGCGGVLFECSTNGEMNMKFSVCVKSEMLSEGLIGEKEKTNYIEEQKENCKSKKMSQTNCVYSPERVDGRPVNNNSDSSEVDCRVPLKKDFQGVQR